MDRNTESHFSNLPIIDIDRSKFERPHDHKFTYNTGDLIPIYVDEVLPGDTVSMKVGSITRMTTPLYPVLDNCWQDVYFFYVPTRLLWEHWEEFWGENKTTHWEQPVEYEIPQIEAPEGGWDFDTIADYMGIPPKVDGISVSHLPFRAYVKIWNDWFRDENLKDPCMMNEDDTTLTGSNTGDYVINAQLGAKPLKAAKAHDYYTSALPSPQKGPSVQIPLGKLTPVITGNAHTIPDTTMQFATESTLSAGTKYNAVLTGISTASAELATADVYSGSESTKKFIPNNLWADLSEATAATITQLRMAFQIQKFYEAQARGGTRYIEFLKNIFGVTSPDARLQRAEYLGGYRTPINISQVIQTSATDAISPQGNTGAFSYTPDNQDVFTHSFVEHGYMIGLAVVRTDHTYQQGIERFWNRKKWSDFYIPQFANLSEQAILNKEIYVTGTSADDEAFGYQEAWADYRYKPSRISGHLRSSYPQTLDSWTYADNYSEQPILSSEWIDETDANVARTLAVQDEDQFISDFYFDSVWVRPMPVYSVPGLIDHH